MYSRILLCDIFIQTCKKQVQKQEGKKSKMTRKKNLQIDGRFVLSLQLHIHPNLKIKKRSRKKLLFKIVGVGNTWY